jgi:hypothetical protein
MVCLLDQDERGMYYLDIYPFSLYQNYIKTLSSTTYNRDQAKLEMIGMCRAYFRGDRTETININRFEHTYTSDDAIYWYIEQSFIYHLVNKVLRTVDEI